MPLFLPYTTHPLHTPQFIREYGEEQVGALDGEDIEGFVGEESPLFRQALLHSKKKLQQEDLQEDHDRIIKWIKDMQERRANQEDEEEKEEVRGWGGDE